MANSHFRSRALLDMAYEFNCMLEIPGVCEGGPGEPAHSNQSIHGKGGSIKAHDCFYVPACRACHREIDSGRSMSREEKFAAWNRAFGKFLPLLMKRLLEND